MKRLEILRLGPLEETLARRVAERLADQFHVAWEIRPEIADPAFAFHPVRGQFHSSEILAWLETRTRPETWRLLALTAVDLYIPILTFAFGEARLGPGPAVASIYRLRQELYGLPADPGLLLERTLREAAHELGHTLGLRHCDDYQCAMASSPSVEWIDLKSAFLCDACRLRVGLPCCIEIRSSAER